MTPAGLLRAAFKILFIAYIAKLAVGRASLFGEHYAVAQQEVQHQCKLAHKCDIDHEMQDLVTDECNEARRGSARWPSWDALGRTAQQTYLCIEVPCTDLLASVFNSTPATLIAGCAMLVAFSYVLSGLSSAWTRALALRAAEATHPDAWMRVQQVPAGALAWQPPYMPTPANTRTPAPMYAPMSVVDGVGGDDDGVVMRKRR